MPSECIICLGESEDDNRLTKKDCSKCLGINIHSDCFEELIKTSGTKCPNCRGRLKKLGDEISDSSSQSSMDSDEENTYLREFLDRTRVIYFGTREVIEDNNIQNINMNRPLYSILKNILYVGLISMLCYLIGAFFVFIYCLIPDACSDGYNQLFTDLGVDIFKLFLGIFFLAYISCYFKSGWLPRNSRSNVSRNRRESHNNQNITEEQIV